MHINWSRHSDVNRGPAVYELRGPRRTPIVQRFATSSRTISRAAPITHDDIVACASIAQKAMGAPSMGRAAESSNPWPPKRTVGWCIGDPAVRTGIRPLLLPGTAVDPSAVRPSGLFNVDRGHLHGRGRTPYRGAMGGPRSLNFGRSTRSSSATRHAQKSTPSTGGATMTESAASPRSSEGR
jgi:hypothetical protein